MTPRGVAVGGTVDSKAWIVESEVESEGKEKG